MLRLAQLDAYCKLESPIEEKLFPYLEKFTHPNCDILIQHEIKITDKITFRPDFILRNRVYDKSIIIECDGADYHNSGQQIARDNLRDASLILDDKILAVFRFGGVAITHFPMLCLEKIREFESELDFLIRYFPIEGNPAKDENWGMIRQSVIDEGNEALVLAMERADDLIVTHDRTWLLNSGIVSKAKFVIKESNTAFNNIELDYSNFIIKKYNG